MPCPALLGSVLSSEGSLQPAYTLNINGQWFTTDPSAPLRDGDSLLVLAVDVGGQPVLGSRQILPRRGMIRPSPSG